MKLNHYSLQLYRIVLPVSADPITRFAAEELEFHLKNYLKIMLNIGEDSETTPYELLLGDCDRALCKTQPIDTLPDDDSFRFRTEDTAFSICGKTPYGTLCGVYHLLNLMGIDWLDDTVTYAEPKDTLDLVCNFDYSFSARIRIAYSDLLFRGNRYLLRQRLHRTVGEHGTTGIDACNTIEYAFRWGMYGHTFEVLVPYAQYYQEHPEYYSFSDNYPGDSARWQLCVTNQAVYEIALTRIRSYLRTHRSCKILSVSQNDSYGDFQDNYCRCPSCEALAQREGSYAGAMLDFVNRIAAAIEDEFPDIIIHTFAYHYTLEPPKTIRPHKNVLVQFCLNKNFNRSLTDCDDDEETKTCRRQVDKWFEISEHVHFWSYLTNFGMYFAAFGNFRSLYEDTVYLLKNGGYGIFQQNNGNSFPFEFSHLRTYLIAKLFQQPEMTYDEYLSHIRFFLRGFFGQESAPAVYDYLMLLQETADHAPPSRGGTVPDAFLWLCDPHFLSDGKRLWKIALRKAKNDEQKQRLIAARIHFSFCELLAIHRKRTNQDAERQYIRCRKKLLRQIYMYYGRIQYGEGRIVTDMSRFDYASDPFTFRTKARTLTVPANHFSHSVSADANSDPKISDLDFRFRAKWQNDILQLKIDVTDPDPTHLCTNEKDWKQDSTEILICETLHGMSRITAGDFGVRVMPDGRYVVLHEKSNDRVRACDVIRTATGYRIDLALRIAPSRTSIGLELVAHNFGSKGYINTRYYNAMRGADLTKFPVSCGILRKK